MEKPKELHRLISEFFLIRGYLRALEEFEREVKEEPQNMTAPSLVDNLFHRVRQGNLDELESFWRTLNHCLFVWVSDTRLSQTVQYLWTSLKRLFLVEAVRRNNAAAVQAFYSGHAKELAGESPIWFSLPYLPSPETHPEFELFFQPKWTSRLKTSLQNCLEECLKERPKPLLESVGEWKKSRRQSQLDLKSTREQLSTVTKQLKSLQITYRDFLLTKDSEPKQRATSLQDVHTSPSLPVREASTNDVCAAARGDDEKQRSEPPGKTLQFVPKFSISETQPPEHLCVSEDLRHFAYSIGNRVHVWRLKEFEKKDVIALHRPARVVQLRFIQQQVAIGQQQSLVVYSLATKQNGVIQLPQEFPLLATFAERVQPNGWDLVVSCFKRPVAKGAQTKGGKGSSSASNASKAKAILARFRDGRLVSKSSPFQTKVTGLSIYHNGRVVVSVDESGGVYLFDEGLKVLQKLQPTEDPLIGIELCNDFSCLVLGKEAIRHIFLRGNGNSVNKMFRLNVMSSIKPPPVFSAGFYKQETKQTYFLCGGQRADGRFGAQLYSTGNNDPVQTVGHFTNPVSGIEWERHLAILTSGTTIRIYEVL